MIKKRILEIDILKIIAITLMVAFHFIYDLNEFANLNIPYLYGAWYWVGKVAAYLFIFLCGINSGFSNHQIKKGFIVLGFGMVITLVTFILFKDEYIKFGILHFLGFCTIIHPVLIKINNILLLIIASVILYITSTGFLDNTIFNDLFSGPSLDYYPVFPYLSLFIFGILTYKLFYYKKESVIGKYTKNKLVYNTSKYSLLIYLIHQPVLATLVIIFKTIYGQ